MSADITTTDKPTPEVVATAEVDANDFVGHLGNALDEAFAAEDAKAAGQTVTPPATAQKPAPTQQQETTTDDTVIDDPLTQGPKSKLPGADVKPPGEVVAPTDPDSDEGIESAVAKETAGMGAKERASWSKLRYELRDARRALKETETLKADLETARKATNPNAALEAKVKELTEALSQADVKVARADITQTSKWQSEVAQPSALISASVSRLAKKYNVSEGSLREALSYVGDDRGDKLGEAAANFNGFDANEFYQAAALNDRVTASANSLRESAAAELKAITEADEAAKTAESAAAKAEWNSALPKAWEKVAADSPALKEVEGADDWNAAVAGAQKFAENVSYDDLGVFEQAQVMHRAAAFPLQASVIKAQETELANLRTALARYKKATPAAGVTPPGGKAAVSPELGFTEAIDAEFANAGL